MGFEEGLKLFKEGNYLAASYIFEAITISDHYNHKAWNALGVTYTKIGRIKEAGTCFNNAVKLKPDSEIYRKNKKINEKKFLEKKEETKPLTLIPQSEKILNKQGLIFPGLILLALIFIIAFILFISPSASPMASLGNNNIQNIQDSNKVNPYETMEIPDSQRYNNSITRGISEMKKNLPGDAVNSFEEGISLNSQDPRAWTGKGYALIEQGKYNLAIQAFDTGIKLDPAYRDALMGKEIAEAAAVSSTL